MEEEHDVSECTFRLGLRALCVSAALVTGVAPGPANAAAEPSGRLQIVHKPDFISVGLQDFDLLQRSFGQLRGEVLNDLTGVTGLFEVDDEDFP